MLSVKSPERLVLDLEGVDLSPALAELNNKVAEINAIIAILDDGKTVFYKDISKGFLDQNGGLSGEIMPDYLHLSARGYDIWGKAIKGDLYKLVK